MSIVLDEYDWAERMINNAELGAKPIETLGRVAKYYYANHYTKKEVRDLMDGFIVRCDPTASLVKWAGTLDYVTKSSARRELIRINGVDITQPELDKIAEIRGAARQRLAFTLLCVAKYWDLVSPNNNGWVNASDKEIMQMANIRLSVSKQCELFGDLIRGGYIENAKRVDNLNVRVLFIRPGTTAMTIMDFRNLGYQYVKHNGGNCYECQSCGLVVKAHERIGAGPPQKYCPECAVKIKTKSSVDAVMRGRMRGIQLAQ